MINKIENKQVTDLTKDAPKQQKPAPSDNLQDASLQISNESLIHQSQQLPSQDSSAVEEAKKLILSGQLDSPENIRAAAEAIIKFGV